jgi:peptidoglycan/LPS O-acetylase OafA/YrhL
MLPVTTNAPAAATRHDKQYRADVQGLRAVAVLSVLLYHAGVPIVTGGYIGVDVFFVISGFLITGLILRELATTGRLRLGQFYARRARRLLPATALVLLFVAVMTVTVLPVTRWPSIAADLFATSLYVVNWTFAARSVDYFQLDAPHSPVQHFWSLAVEEQFYIVWPVLIVALVWVSRRVGKRLSQTRLLSGLLVITALSFVWSLSMTARVPSAAFFVTTTRIWELGLGALIAVTAPSLARISASVRRAGGWLGLAVIVAAAVWFTDSTAFPGYAALAPTLGAAAVLMAGLRPAERGLPVLRGPVMESVGTLSYSLYLWHWPVLVGAGVLWGNAEGRLGWPLGLAAAGLSFVPAWIAYRAVERPVHHSRMVAARAWRGGLVGVASVALGLGASFAVGSRVPTIEVAGDAPGAAVLGFDPSSVRSAEFDASAVGGSSGVITPSPVDAATDYPDTVADGCFQSQQSAEVLSCTYGDAASATVIALVGDSHANQWQSALRQLADEHGWRLETYTKSGCFFGDGPVRLVGVDGPQETCRAWSSAVSDLLIERKPDIVLISTAGAYSYVGTDGRDILRPAADTFLAQVLADSWQDLRDADIPVAAIMDVPLQGVVVPECVAQNPADLTRCGTNRDEAVSQSAQPIQRAALRLAVPSVSVIDMTPWICPPPSEECVPVIGNVLVWRDSNHLSDTYVRTLAPFLDVQLSPLL